jgi:hypothetical protein
LFPLHLYIIQAIQKGTVVLHILKTVNQGRVWKQLIMSLQEPVAGTNYGNLRGNSITSKTCINNKTLEAFYISNYLERSYVL